MKAITAKGFDYIVKIKIEGTNEERTIGIVNKLTYTVVNGQKSIFVVDSPFPAEIAHAAAPSFVRGTINVWMPRGLTLESLNLSPFRHDEQGYAVGPYAKYFSLRVYDRLSRGIVLSLDWCKISQYTVDITANSLVQASISFEGMLASQGNAYLG
jgi:hypothetical protein